MPVCEISVNHGFISCKLLGIGTELLNEIQEVMREDKEKAVREAVSKTIIEVIHELCNLPGLV